MANPKKLPQLEVEFIREGNKVTVRVIRQIPRATAFDNLIHFGNQADYGIRSCAHLEIYPESRLLYLHGTSEPDREQAEGNFPSDAAAKAAVKVWKEIIRNYRGPEAPEKESPVSTVKAKARPPSRPVITRVRSCS